MGPANNFDVHVIDRKTPETQQDMYESDGRSNLYSGPIWGTLLSAAYLVAVILPLGAFVLLRGESDRTPVAEAGADCAVVGYTILALQFVIAARFRWIEAPFGLDLLTAFHKRMALVALTLLFVHPVAMASAQGWFLITRLHVPWYLWVGRITLLTLMVHASVSVTRRVIRLPYHRWKALHNVLAPTVLLLGFLHSAAAGDDITGAGRIVWSVLTAVAITSYLHVRFIRPRLLMRDLFRVAEIKRERPGVWTLSFESCAGRPLRFRPGQFHFLRFFGGELPVEEHPFSIASSPAEDMQVRVTIKECGDFTSAIGRVTEGTLVTAHGPFGRFCPSLHDDGSGELVFVAAGVGITPFLSILRHMRDRGISRRVRLIYANRRLQDVLFLEELSEMEASSTQSLSVVHVLSSGPAVSGTDSGRLDCARLLRLCGGVENKAFYLCCPPQMTAALVHGLRKAGVNLRHIHADYFSL